MHDWCRVAARTECRVGRPRHYSVPSHFTALHVCLSHLSPQELNLDNRIVIVDEAHNIEQVCADSVSFEITAFSLQQAADEVGTVLEASQSADANTLTPSACAAHRMSLLSRAVAALHRPAVASHPTLMPTPLAQWYRKINDGDLDPPPSFSVTTAENLAILQKILQDLCDALDATLGPTPKADQEVRQTLSRQVDWCVSSTACATLGTSPTPSATLTHGPLPCICNAGRAPRLVAL